MEEQARESPVGGRPLWLAVLFSVTVHALIVWLLQPLSLPESRPSDRETLPVFNVALMHPQGDRDNGSGERPANAAQSTPPAAAEAPAQTPLTQPPPRPADSPEPAVPPDPADIHPPITNQLQAAPAHEQIIVSAGPAPFAVPAPPPVELADLRVQQTIDSSEAAAIEEYLEEITEQLPQLLGSGKPLRWRSQEREFTAAVELQPATKDTELDRALVTISTEADGERRETELQFKRLAFSSFAQLVNRWDPDVAISQDRIEGRFHSNSAVNVEAAQGARPTFTGKVTTAARVKLGRGLRKQEIFLGGLEMRAQRIPMPRDVLPLGGDAQLRPDQLRQFSSDTNIKFHQNGEYSWRSEDSPMTQRAIVPEGGLFLIGQNRSRLLVEGTVKGKIVVYSTGRITIAGDLRYARDPVAIPDSPDFLGLISEGYVEVGPPQVVGRGDLTVQAAIYAGRRFSVRSFRTRNRGTLHIYGSVTAGSISATEPRYATRLVFDPRLELQRPPGFPVTDRYELENWNRHWTIANSGNESRQ
jgi:hypothetical protein